MGPNKEKENIIWKNFFFCKDFVGQNFFLWNIFLGKHLFGGHFCFDKKKKLDICKDKDLELRHRQERIAISDQDKGFPKLGRLWKLKERNRMGIKRCKLTKLGKKIASNEKCSKWSEHRIVLRLSLRRQYRKPPHWRTDLGCEITAWTGGGVGGKCGGVGPPVWGPTTRTMRGPT